MNQLARVRRHRTGTQQIERERRIGDDHIIQFAVTDQVVGCTVTVLHTQLGMQVRLTDIQIDQDRLLTRHRIQRCQVRTQEGLTITGLGRSNRDHQLIFTLHHKLHTCTDRAKHLTIGRLGSSTNQCRVLVSGVTNRSDQVEHTQLEQVLRRTDLVVEQLAEHDQHQRDDESNDQVRGHRLLLGSRIHDSRRTRFVHDLVVRRVAGFLDLGLGTLLQEEGVVVVINIILTLYTYHLQLLGGQGHDLTLHLGCMLQDVVLLYIQLRAHGTHHLRDSLLDIIHVLGVLGVVHVSLRQLATLYTQVVELLYQRGQHRLVQAHGRRSDHRTALDIGLQILGQVVEIGLFETQRLHLLVVALSFAEQLARIGRYVHKLVRLTEIGHRTTAHIQRVLYHTQLAVDEANRVLCHLVLFLQGLLQIGLHQLVDKLAVSLRSLRGKRQSQYRTSLRHKGGLQAVHKLIHQGLTRTETDVDLALVDHQLGRPDSDGKHLAINLLTIPRHNIHPVLYGRRTHTHRTVLVERYLIHVLIGRLVDTLLLYQDRRLTVQVTGLELTLGDILSLHKRQRVHHAADQVVRTEHDDLIVDIGVCHVQTKTLHQVALRASIARVLLDHHRSLRVVRRNPFAVFEHRQTKSDTYKDHKQIPIVHEREQPLDGVELHLLF